MTTQTNWSREADSHYAINTTIRCQHKCVYCFEGKRQNLRNVDSEDTKRLLDRAAKEVGAVIFMGAEPTLNPALPELIRYGSSLGLRMSISTNALRLSNWEYLLALHDAGLQTVELSFPYPDEAVYSRITGRPSKGFQRLMRALDNLNRLWTDQGTRQLSVHVNLVVSRFNFGRLDDVIGHLKMKLPPDSFIITVKRVSHPAHMPLRQFIDTVYVPCGELRSTLPKLTSHVEKGIVLGFRGFPLCAIPGLEKLDFELGYYLNDVRVRHNFVCQDNVKRMYPKAELWKAHHFDQLCRSCALTPICLIRDLFVVADPVSQHEPIPLVGDLPEYLRSWVVSQPRGAALLETRQKDETGLRPTPQPKVSPDWVAFIADSFFNRLKERVKADSRLAGCTIVETVGAAIKVAGPMVGAVASIEILPIGGPAARGFICGPVRIRLKGQMPQFLSRVWIQAAYITCLRVEADRAWPACLTVESDTFLRRVWKVFNTSLMPRTGSAGCLVDCLSGDDEVCLYCETTRHSEFRIVLRPIDQVENAFAEGHKIGLQYHVSAPFENTTDWMGIVQAFASILSVGQISDTLRHPFEIRETSL